jgi:hypothetical protein
MDLLLKSKMRQDVPESGFVRNGFGGTSTLLAELKSQLGMPVMKTSFLGPSQEPHALFKIRGRMFPREEFLCRLKNLCSSLGFSTDNLSPATTDFSAGGAENRLNNGGGDTVCLLSTRVSYNPNWGCCCGLPRLLNQQKFQSARESTPAEFVAPFLHLYRSAEEHMYLSQSPEGRALITLPESLLRQGEELSGCKVVVQLARIVEPETDGVLRPLMISGDLHSFVVSAKFHSFFAPLHRDWQPGRKLSIAGELGREIFAFEIGDKTVWAGSPYLKTILPSMGEIVTHPTPNLRAAEIHLEQLFLEETARLATVQGGQSRLLCLAGLDIDMTPFTGQEEHYFVPWRAYIRNGEGPSNKVYSLQQDDLFVELLQQEKHCAG